MRLTLNIDGYSHQIDSTDPELIGKWVAEIFARVVASGWTPATYITAQAYPSFIPDGTPQGKLDWIADTRIIGGVFTAASPEELLAGLAKQLEEQQAIRDNA